MPCCSGAWRWRRPRARFRTKLWSFSTGYLIDHSPRPSLRALSPDGKPLYIGGPETNQIDDVAMAIDTGNGTQVWDLDPLGVWGESSGSSPALSPDGKTLYIGSADQLVYAVDAGSGTKVWSFATWGTCYSPPPSPPLHRVPGLERVRHRRCEWRQGVVLPHG